MQPNSNRIVKRSVAALALAAVVIGGGAAWAHTGERAVKREALRECREAAREQNPDADAATLREAVKSCLEAQGMEVRPGIRLSEEQRAQIRECREQAREGDPDADRPTLMAAVRSCLEQAGLVPPLTAEQQERRATRLRCFEEAKAEHGGDRSAIRDAVRECVQQS